MMSVEDEGIKKLIINNSNVITSWEIKFLKLHENPKNVEDYFSLKKKEKNSTATHMAT